MKNLLKFIGIIALVAVIGFAFITCDDGNGGGGGQGVAPTVTTASLPGGTQGTAYSQTLAATGDTPITWSIDTGSLPDGLALSGNTIAGTPTTANTFNFTVKATNATGSNTKALSITIAPAPVALTITTTTLLNGAVGTAYSQTLTATGDAPITWSIESGTLPAGLSLSGNTIAGTPSTTGTSTFTVKATNATGDDTKQFSITIASAGSPVITTPSLQNGTVGTAYSQTLTATGDTPITWNLESGTLPAGLTLSGNTIAGSPSTTGTSTFTVKATNAAGNDTKALAIIIAPSGGGGGNGTNTYISYDGDGSRYKLVVTENSSRAAFTPQNGDTYTLTVEGFGWGTSTGTVTSFSGGSYTLSNNGTALNLATSSEAISSIPEAIVYDAGEYSQMSDGTKTPTGSMVTASKYFGTWGDGTNTLTITATGWTFSSPGGGMGAGFNYSGTYTIGEAMTGTVYELYNGTTLYRRAAVDYNDHNEIGLMPEGQGADYTLTRQ